MYDVTANPEEDLKAAESGKMPDDMLQRMHSARQYRSILIPMWDASFEFLRGNQRLTNDTQAGRVGGILGQTRTKAISNRLLPIYRGTVAALGTQFPHFHVNSISPSYNDTIKRIACSQVLSAWWKINRMEQTWRRVVQWLSPGGNAALWTYYDGEEEKVCTEVVGCYDIVWEAEARSMEEADWCSVRRILTRAQAVLRWPDYKETIMKIPAASASDNFSRAYMPHDRIEIWYVYFKDGRCGLWIGSTGNKESGKSSESEWLEETKTPEGIFPIAFMRWSPIEDRLYGMSQLWPLLDMQVQYNLYRNFMLESVKLMANPIWVVSKQANVNMRQITNKPGQILFYNQNAVEPKRMPGPSLSSDVYEVQNRQLAEMEDVGNIHNVSMGKRAPGVTAAVSMQTLIQQDMQGLYITMQEMARAMEEAATHALVIWKAYMPTKKSVAILDPTFGVTVTRELDKTNLVDSPEVTIESGTMFSASQKERDTMIMQLAQLGAIPPDQIMKHLSFKLDTRGELEKMQMLSHAQDLLRALLSGHNIELIDEPALLLAVRNVFGEFIRSPAYYDVYTADALQAAQQGDQDAQNAIRTLENVKSVYQQVAQQMAMAAQGQMQGGPTGSLPKGPDMQGQGAPQGPEARPVLNDPMNPTAGANESKLRTGMTAA